MSMYQVTYDLANVSADDYRRAVELLESWGFTRQDLPNTTFIGRKGGLAPCELFKDALAAVFITQGIPVSKLAVSEIVDIATWPRPAPKQAAWIETLLNPMGTGTLRY